MYYLLSKLQEHFKKNEATTMGDIAYLPTMVGAVKAEIQKLKRKKGKWNLEILEDKEGYAVYFEDQLKIEVPRKHWDSFTGIFNEKIKDRFCLDLETQLMEKIEISKKQLVESRKLELKNKITQELNCPEFISADKAVQKYLSVFPVEENLAENSLIGSLSRIIENYIQQTLSECGNSLGQIDLKIKNLFSEFDPSSTLINQRYKSSYRGVDIILEARVNFAKEAFYSICIQDEEVADRLEEAVSNLTRIQHVFYPRLGQILSENGILENIKEVIDDMEN